MSLRHAEDIYRYRGHVLVDGPDSEPVTADELRTQVRAPSTMLGDTEAEELITEARQLIEDQYGIALEEQTWRLALDAWPMSVGEWWDGVRQTAITELDSRAGQVTLPRYPLSSVTSVKVYAADDTETTVTVSSVFSVDVYQRPGRLRLKSGATWPVAGRTTNGIVIDYVAGYATVPAPLKRAVKVLAAFLWSHRGDGCEAVDALKESGAARILDAYRVRQI